MKMNTKHVIPALAAIVLSASAALAQMPPPGQGPRGANRTPPTAEQQAQRLAQRCADIAARGAAQFTYIEERLKLTAQQKPLFDRWKAVVQSERAPAQTNCVTPRPQRDANAQRPTLPERNARLEQALKDRLASLQKIRPVQEALYNALTAEQKQVFESRNGRGGPRIAMGGRMGGREGFGRGPGGRGGFDGPGAPGPRGGRI
jgi:hypothetical protein